MCPVALLSVLDYILLTHLKGFCVRRACDRAFTGPAKREFRGGALAKAIFRVTLRLANSGFLIAEIDGSDGIEGDGYNVSGLERYHERK